MDTWYIDDYDQYRISITNGYVDYMIPKFRIYMTVTEPYVDIYWSNTEQGSDGLIRTLRIDYNDVVDGYSGYISNPASAAALKADIEAMIVSGFGGGDVLTAKADLLSHDGVSDTILPGGTNEYILRRDNSTQTGLKWDSPVNVVADGGGVVGPASSVDNDVALYNGTTGKLIKAQSKTNFIARSTTTKTADYTLALTDAWSTIVGSTASSVMLTVPANATVAFPTGTTIIITSASTGLIFLEAAVGVTITSLNNHLGILPSGGVVRATKTDTNEWYLDGDLKSALDVDAEAYISAVETLGGSFTSNEQRYINTFVDALKGTGSLWTKTHFCHLYIGGTMTTIMLNLVDPVDADANHRLEATGSPTINANGVTFNGSSNYLNINYTPSASAAQNDKCYAFYWRSVGTGANFGAIDGVGKGDEILIDAGACYWSLSTTFDNPATPATKTGFWLMNRTSSTAADIRRNDVSVDTYAGATDTNINLSLYLGCRNLAGSPNGYSADNLCFDWGGASLSSAEATALYNACVALQTSLGRNV